MKSSFYKKTLLRDNLRTFSPSKHAFHFGPVTPSKTDSQSFKSNPMQRPRTAILMFLPRRHLSKLQRAMLRAGSGLSPLGGK